VSGNQSLLVPATGSGGFFYRVLAVPVPSQDFWARLYVRLDNNFGNNSHDSIFGASDGGLQADVNGEALVELSEQFNQVLLNIDDRLIFENMNSGPTLAGNTWHCMEAHYNGGNGDIEIFVGGEAIISAPGAHTATYQTFRIGYMRYNDDRNVWFDDVVVASSRVGCN
jgi:hypothetical protein